MFGTREYFGIGARQFFRLILQHDTLQNYFVTNFAVVQDFKFSISELEDMMPWERMVYVTLIQQRIEKENLRIQQQKALRK